MSTATMSQGLVATATDSFIHGELLSMWIVDYVDLEESLAVGSIAQEEYAHAATLFLAAGLDDEARDRHVFETPLSEWTPAQLVGSRLHDWPSTIVRGLLLAQAGIVRAEGMLASDDPQLRSAGGVFLAEYKLHAWHWGRWIRVLAESEQSSSELSAKAPGVVALGTDTFGLQTDHADAHQDWVARVAVELSGIVDVEGVLGSVPVARRTAADYPELVGVVARLRELRLGPDDGVRGLYR